MPRHKPESNGQAKSRFFDPIAFNQIRQQIQNWGWADGNCSPGGFNRDPTQLMAWYPQGITSYAFVGEQCGWASWEQINPWFLRDIYERDPVANTVVTIMPRECWQKPPKITDGDDPTEKDTDFLNALKELGRKLKGEASWHGGDEGNPIYSHLKRLNVLSRIGQFGVMLLGFADGKNLQDPVDGVQYLAKTRVDPIKNVRRKIVRNAAGELQQWKKEEVIGHRVRTIRTNQRRMPDCLMPKWEEERLRKIDQLGPTDNSTAGKELKEESTRSIREPSAPPLSAQEVAAVNQWARARDEFVANVQQAAEVRERWKCNSSPSGEHEFGGTPDRTSACLHCNMMLTSLPTVNLVDGGGYVRGADREPGRFIEGTDKQYASTTAGWGLGQSQPVYPSMAGTDQQYFGVQFGPSEQPADKPAGKELELVFVRPYSEDLVQIVRWEWNINNPRFGLPVMYRITLNDPRNRASGIGLPLATVFVHWSRVIHCSEVEGPSEVLTTPPLVRVLNDVFDDRKISGASAAGYWMACFTGLSAETNPQLGGDVLLNKGELQEMFQQYFGGLNRALITRGLSIKTLAPQVIDPTPFHAVQIERICIRLRCPKRVFLGSERGEAASAQDDEAWNEVKREYCNNTITPVYMVPFFDRLILVGVLPEPEEEGYGIVWPDFDALGDKDKAVIMLQHTQAYAAYMQSGIEAKLPFEDFLVLERGLTKEEAEEMTKNAEQQEEKMLDDHGDKQDAADDVDLEPKPPAGFAKKAPPPMFGIPGTGGSPGTGGPGAGKPGAIPGMGGGTPGAGRPGGGSMSGIGQGFPMGAKAGKGQMAAQPTAPGGQPAGSPPSGKGQLGANEEVENVFCAGGPGSGVDPSCSSGGKGGGEGKEGEAPKAKKWRTAPENRVRKALRADPNAKPEHLKEFNRLLRAQRAINKAAKGPEANTDVRNAAKVAKDRLAEFKQHLFAGEVDQINLHGTVASPKKQVKEGAGEEAGRLVKA
jgi:hypothetical protein